MGMVHNCCGGVGDHEDDCLVLLRQERDELLAALKECVAQLCADEPDYGKEGDAVYKARLAISRVEGYSPWPQKESV